MGYGRDDGLMICPAHGVTFRHAGCGLIAVALVQH